MISQMRFSSPPRPTSSAPWSGWSRTPNQTTRCFCTIQVQCAVLFPSLSPRHVAHPRPRTAADNDPAGHGGQTKDLDGDEEDGQDETIYPVDFKSAGHIVDDQIHDICVARLKAGVRLTTIFDSCHSGSILDLPYVYSTKGALKEPNLAKEAGQGLLGAAMSYARGDIGGMMKGLGSLLKSATSGNEAYEKTMRTKTSPADVILWSGSKDDQTSADASIASQATGAMSYAFIKAVRQNPDQTYLQLLNSIRDILQEKYSQKPQLSCSHPLGMSSLLLYHNLETFDWADVANPLSADVENVKFIM